MLQQAYAAVDRIMQLAKELGGVISGEHGIGITKFDFLEEQEIAPFTAYKQKVDPHGHFNKGKLLKGSNLEHAYTPSFNLMELESLILEKASWATSPTRSRTVCVAASASRCAAPMCRAPTCCIRRATRSSPPRC